MSRHAKSSASLERLVLVAIDDTADARLAFNYYVQHLHRPRNKVQLIHVLKPFVISTIETATQKSASKQKAVANEAQTIKKLQAEYSAAMRQHMIPGQINIVSHSMQPGKVICETVADDRCSYVVLGCRCAAASRRAGCNGSVVEHVLAKAKCPVVVVRMPDPPPAAGHVLIDSRRSSAAAAEQVRQRRISAPSRLFGLTSSAQASGPGSAQPISRTARQRSQSTVVAPRLDQLSLLHRPSAAATHTDRIDEEDVDHLE